MTRKVLLDPALLAIVAAGCVLRILAAAGHSHHLSADARSYSMLSSDLADHLKYGGKGLSGPFHWPPGAPFLFAFARVFGLSPYVAQVVVGTLAIVAAALVAWAVAGRRAGLLAAVLVALYPPLVFSTAELLSEPLGALLLALAVLAFGWGLRDRRALALAPCGVLLGLVALTRADLLVAPLVVAGVAFALQRSWRAPLVVIAAAALTIAPWTIFVATKKHELVPVSTGGGSNLYIGTYLPGHGTLFGLKHAYAPVLAAHGVIPRGTPAFRVRATTIFSYVARDHRGNGKDAYLRSLGLRNGWHYATHRPVAFARMLGSKAGRLWLDYTHGTLKRTQTLPRIGHILLVLLALVALGFGLRARRAGELVCIASLLVLATVINAVLVSEARHLLPLLPLLFAGAAAGVVLSVRGRSGSIQNAELSMTRP